MDNNMVNLVSSLASILNNNRVSDTSPTNTTEPKISQSYPYGDFPIKYTKSGQEYLRQKREYGYSRLQDTHIETTTPAQDTKIDSPINIQDLLPIISTITKSDTHSNPIQLLKTLAPLLFKDNPNIAQMLDYLKPPKPSTPATTNTLCVDKINIDEYIPITQKNSHT